MVVCDEPTSALDVSVQAAILNLLADLQQQEHATYLFISHDLGLVRYLSDRIVVLYLGRVMEVGPAETVFTGPHHPYTEALFSAVPSLDGQRPDRIRLTGEIPSAADPPSGCVFHTRCPRRLSTGICESTEPPLLEEEPGHLIRCHIPIAELRNLQRNESAPSQGGSCMTRKIDHSRLGRLRQGQGEIANHIIDEFAAGRLSRRDFIRRATVVGISVPLLGSILAACSSSSSSPSSSSSSSASASAGGAPGAVIKAGIITPTGAINPVTVADQGGLDMLAQTGEYLCLSTQKLTLKPVLATSWSPNSNADVWTFKIRQGVKFHNGSPLTADDVVYTYQLQTNPKGETNALSAFGGVLAPAGREEGRRLHGGVPPGGPERELPVPDLLRQLQHDHPSEGLRPGQVAEHVHRHRPVQARLVHAEVGATFTRNESYWGNKALPSQTQFTFYDTQPPSILALTGGTIDVLGQFSVTGGEALLNGSYNVIKLKSSAHRQLSMRCDQAPFTDPRVRQAIALTLNRPADRQRAVQGLRRRGQRQPVRARLPVHQHQHRPAHAEHRQGQVAAGGGRAPLGFSTQLVTENIQEIPQYAQIVAQSAAAIGVKINLNVETSV